VLVVHAAIAAAWQTTQTAAGADDFSGRSVIMHSVVSSRTAIEAAVLQRGRVPSGSPRVPHRGIILVGRDVVAEVGLAAGLPHDGTRCRTARVGAEHADRGSSATTHDLGAEGSSPRAEGSMDAHGAQGADAAARRPIPLPRPQGP